MARVLIVDDSKVIQMIVSSCVSSLGGEVVGVGNDGEEGLELYNQLKPDLTLLDITMPNKDGRECLRDILKMDPRANVVMLSALNSEEVIKECLTLGAKAFIDKPTASQRENLKDELKRYFGVKVA